MAGVDTIKNEILQEAEETAKGIIADAEAAKTGRIETAKAELADATAKNEVKAKADAAAHISRAEAKAESESRRAVLSARSEVINDVIEKAYEKLKGRDSASYFAMLIDMVGAAAHGEEGTIVLSPADMQRLPSDFESNVKAAAAKKGGSLKLDPNGDPAIDSGFVLKYSGLDENCSLKAIFDSRDIELNQLEEDVLDNASYFGRIFARSGGLSDAVAQALKEHEKDFYFVLCRYLQKFIDARIKALGVLLPNKVVQIHAHNVETQLVRPAKLLVDLLRIESFRTPHFDLIDCVAVDIVTTSKKRLLGIPLIRLFRRPTLRRLRRVRTENKKCKRYNRRDFLQQCFYIHRTILSCH